MKDLLKNKKVLVGLVVVVGAVGYYVYDQKRKAKIKADAEVLANTPPKVTTPALPKHGANYKPVTVSATNQPTLQTID